MAGERAEALPDVLREWVESKATELDVPPQSVVERAVLAYRLVDEHDDRLESTLEDDFAAALDTELPDRVEALENGRTDAVATADRLEAVESSFDEKLEDVRGRVIQVKREIDGKAPADHDHPDLATRLDEQAAEVERLREDLEAVEAHVDEGFENYEEVVEYLSEAVEETDDRLDRLVQATADLRRHAGELEGASSERAAAADLKTTANRLGVRTADCDDCEASVDIGLLSAPRCPHCSTTFADVEPARGFFGSATLVPGQRPALEGSTDHLVEAEELLEGDDDD